VTNNPSDPAMPRVVDIDTIDAWLPQTQCTQCGYPNCRAYAQALAERHADINQCPPGGDHTIRGLAVLLGIDSKPMNPSFGRHHPRRTAVIDESRCIGCTLCIQACPVDAIVGAAKQMHTVIEPECTGCELCVSPCPVDCIDLHSAARAKPGSNWRWPDYSPAETARARQRTVAHQQRLAARQAHRKARQLAQHRHRQKIKQEIQAAVERVRARRAKQP
jgi:electron transport complex protein RnfB